MYCGRGLTGHPQVEVDDVRHIVRVVQRDRARCKKRGITRDCTPFLLILQGMTLQLQGITPPSLLILQGRSLTWRGGAAAAQGAGSGSLAPASAVPMHARARSWTACERRLGTPSPPPARGLRYSSRTARSGLGLDRVVRLFRMAAPCKRHAVNDATRSLRV